MPSLCTLPDFLSHYFERDNGPFRSLTNLPLWDAEAVLENIRKAGVQFASQRPADFLVNRQGIEDRIRNHSIQKGGNPLRGRPHYFVLGSCEWLLDWYESGCELRLPVTRFRMQAVSFTYGDSFPTMR
jgi:hypothetical protein